jgi:hypothetical protein
VEVGVDVAAAEHVDGEIQEVGAFAVAACALPDPEAAEGFEAQSASDSTDL